jgi:glycosyltransferase involved in cell wall biosynthesis
MSGRRLRLLHAIHDFLPRHQAGSEIYAFELARELSLRHDVFVLAAEYDATVPHGTLRWRSYGGLPVIELINNWEFQSLDESYASPRLNAQFRHVLDAVQPDVLHVHNLLNLTFDLPRLARERGARSVATLHDYTLVCPSGGQRVHIDEAHVCEEIDPDRCSRCFQSSALYRQMRASRATRGGRSRLTAAMIGRMPGAARTLSGLIPGPAVNARDISRRLASARHVFDVIDFFVAPSPVLGDEYVRLGLSPERLEVSDYGFVAAPRRRVETTRALRIGFVGTLAWHKGAHVLLEAARGLRADFEIQVHGDPRVVPEYTARLRGLAEGLPIRFAGPFNRLQVSDVYGGLDVLVVPSLWPENSPLVIHEAFMHGVAVVAARIGGIPALVRDGINGLLYEPFSASALTRALQQLADNPALSPRLASAAPPVKSMAQDAHEWERRYERVLAAPVASTQ